MTLHANKDNRIHTYNQFIHNSVMYLDFFFPLFLSFHLYSFTQYFTRKEVWPAVLLEIEFKQEMTQKSKPKITIIWQDHVRHLMKLYRLPPLITNIKHASACLGIRTNKNQEKRHRKW